MEGERVKRIGDVDHGRDNNFNLLRLVAASAVLVSHAWLIVYGRAVPEPLTPTTNYSLGIASVTVFFAISGYFITKSFDRRVLFADFAAARVARIYPGLIVALLLTAFALGPAITSFPIGEYLSHRDTWKYPVQNALLIHQQFGLPGVLMASPFVGVVNASLWTLKYEVGCYAGVVLAGYLGLLKPRLFPLVLAGAAAFAIIIPSDEMALISRVALLCASFALGSGAYVYRAHVPLSAPLALALFVLAAIAHGTPVYPLCYAAALGYAALAIGFADAAWLRGYNRLGDYSYGVYIYAFPVGQAVGAMLPGIGPWTLIALTFPVTLLLAVASWRWVESPALAHRHRLAAWLRLKRTEARAPAA